MHLIFYVKKYLRSDRVDKMTCGFVTDNAIGLGQSVTLVEPRVDIDSDLERCEQLPLITIAPTLAQQEEVRQVSNNPNLVTIALITSKATVTMIGSLGTGFRVSSKTKDYTTNCTVRLVVKGKVIFQSSKIDELLDKYGRPEDKSIDALVGGKLEITLTEGSLVAIALKPDVFALSYDASTVVMSVKRDNVDVVIPSADQSNIVFSAPSPTSPPESTNETPKSSSAVSNKENEHGLNEKVKQAKVTNSSECHLPVSIEATVTTDPKVDSSESAYSARSDHSTSVSASQPKSVPSGNGSIKKSKFSPRRSSLSSKSWKSKSRSKSKHSSRHKNKSIALKSNPRPKSNQFALQMKNINLKPSSPMQSPVSVTSPKPASVKEHDLSTNSSPIDKVDSLAEIINKMIETSHSPHHSSPSKDKQSGFEQASTYIVYYKSSEPPIDRPVGIFTGQIGWTPQKSLPDHCRVGSGKLDFRVRQASNEKDYLAIKTCSGQDKCLLTINNQESAVTRIYAEKGSGYAFRAGHGSLTLTGKLLVINDLTNWKKDKKANESSEKSIASWNSWKASVSPVSPPSPAVSSASTSPRPHTLVEVLWGRLCIYVCANEHILLLHHSNNYRINDH